MARSSFHRFCLSSFLLHVSGLSVTQMSSRYFLIFHHHQINLSCKRYNARSFPFFCSRFLCSRAAIHLFDTVLCQLTMLPTSLCNGLPDLVCGLAEHENIQMLPSDIVSVEVPFRKFSYTHLLAWRIKKRAKHI